MTIVPIALVTLVPLMLGPLPAPDRSIVASLCNGGSIEIPVRRQMPDRGDTCLDKACHAGCNRKKFDLSQ